MICQITSSFCIFNRDNQNCSNTEVFWEKIPIKLVVLDGEKRFLGSKENVPHFFTTSANLFSRNICKYLHKMNREASQIVWLSVLSGDLLRRGCARGEVRASGSGFSTITREEKNIFILLEID